jgi:hypothetical protein
MTRRSAFSQLGLAPSGQEPTMTTTKASCITILSRASVAAFSTAVLLACSGAPDGATEPLGTSHEELIDGDRVELGTRVHKLPFRDPEAPQLEAPKAAAASAHLDYYGGPVISHVKVVLVEYGSGTYQSFVTGSGASSVSGFYTGVTNSTYFDWLKEYDTSSQSIGRGSFAGAFAIKPASSRDKASISDANIQAELKAQITAGHLPAPTNDTLYSVHFPKGKRITQGGSSSCVSGGFCAYHGTLKINGQYVFYSVLPDMSSGSGCDRGCGNGSAFGNQTSVASHEMIEAVTDAAVGLATTYGPPLAWYDATNGEIGDICNAEQGTVTGGNGTKYTVQKEWSNQSGTCKTQ